MRLAILGTGSVGQNIAARCVELGHEVAMGTRDPQATLARTNSDSERSQNFAEWAAEHPPIRVLSFRAAAMFGDVVVNATSGSVTLEALHAAGADNLAGKVLIDVTNPLDFSAGFPPTLTVKDTDSLGEQIQREFPDAKVVKSLNTLTASLMVNPRELAGGEHSVFVSGDDPEAKQMVADLLHEFGHTDVIDLGDITTARGTEMWLPLWLRLMRVLGTANFNVKVVR
ncbi:MAG: NAD(P)-binding domain-containing protein [Actinomycetota bacterium]|nr:NAD(P)-binding domain-containing protein [Actinomycetota bacterium]